MLACRPGHGICKLLSTKLYGELVLNGLSLLLLGGMWLYIVRRLARSCSSTSSRCLSLVRGAPLLAIYAYCLYYRVLLAARKSHSSPYSRAVSLHFGMCVGLLILAAAWTYSSGATRVAAALQRELHRRDYRTQEAPPLLATRWLTHAALSSPLWLFCLLVLLPALFSPCLRHATVALRSACPGGADGWRRALVPVLAGSGAERPCSLNYVDIGANKGYAVSEFLQSYQSGWRASNLVWREHLRVADSVKACGECDSCSVPLPPVAATRACSTHILAVDLLSSNVRLLSRVFRALGVRGRVVHAAATDGSVSFVHTPSPRKALAGVESLGIATSGPRVRALTVDARAHEHNLTSVGVDWLTIDTEGWDGLVLRGAKSLLTRRRVRVLEFEYHGIGPWRTLRLRDTLSWLDGMGYECFWQGNDGKLAPATTRCNFEFRSWSNLVCAQEYGLLTAMRRYT